MLIHEPFIVFLAPAANLFGGTHADSTAEACVGVNIERAVPGKTPPSNMIAVYFDYTVKCTIHRTMFKAYRLFLSVSFCNNFADYILPGIVNAIFACDAI